ncbi:MAG: hypothetical protein JO197_11585 [Acidobacteria bacterium]|nr:hypothetical protein [Acidobacteriota bacterium]MBV9476118.1 hypothetical protein [Acidobacteriota bacterium]
MVTLLSAALSTLIDVHWDCRALTPPQRQWCETFARAATTLTTPAAPPSVRIDAMRAQAAAARAAELPLVATYLERVSDAAAGGDAVAAETALRAAAHSPVLVLVRVQKASADASPFGDVIVGVRDPDDAWLLSFQQRLDAFARTLSPASAAWDKGTVPPGVSAIGDLVARAGASAQSTAPASYPPFDASLRPVVGRSWIHWKNMTVAGWFERQVKPAGVASLDGAAVRALDGAALSRWYALRYVTSDLGPKVVNGKPLQDALGDAWAPIVIVKADVTAVLASQWLRRGSLDTDLATFLGVTIHTLNDVVRGDAPPQHRASTCIALNWCLRHGGLVARKNGWHIAPRAMLASLRTLASEVLAIETAGDRERAAKLIAEYGTVTPEIQTMLDRLPPPTPPKATVHYDILESAR